MQKISKHLTWPMAAVLIAGGGMFTAITIWAPPEARELALGANGLLWTVVSYYIRSPRDTAVGE